MIVVSWIQAQFTEIDIGHMRTHRIQEMPVVRNNYHGAFARFQDTL